MISLEKNKDRAANKEGTDICLGKLRALTTENDKFVLYDSGENFNKNGV